MDPSHFIKQFNNSIIVFWPVHFFQFCLHWCYFTISFYGNISDYIRASLQPRLYPPYSYIMWTKLLGHLNINSFFLELRVLKKCLFCFCWNNCLSCPGIPFNYIWIEHCFEEFVAFSNKNEVWILDNHHPTSSPTLQLIHLKSTGWSPIVAHCPTAQLYTPLAHAWH